MVARRRGKRKSDSKNLLFEVNDDDVSPDNSENECNGPETKIVKTDSKFVESVVTALSNLENEAKKETESKPIDNCSMVDNEVIEIFDTSSTQEHSTLTKGSNSSVLIINDSLEECLPASQQCDTSVLIIEDSILDETDPDIKQNECLQSVDNLNESVLILNESIEDIESTVLNKNKQVSDCGTPDFNSVSSDVDIEDGELATETDKVDASDSLIQINFSNKNISNLFKRRFLQFFKSCPELSIIKLDDLSFTLKQNTPVDTPVATVVLNEVSLSKKKKRKKAKKDKDLFILDPNPSKHESFTTKYSSKFQIAINDDNVEEEEVQKNSAHTCFNCEQAHSLKDCPLPKDFAKINLKYQQLKQKREKLQARYHLEEDQKYAHLAPGKVSDKLREALGLKHNQIPPYIYTMRQLGYPPGWLEEAKFVYSNLALFDIEGNNVRPDNTKKKQGLDPNKIVEYPGFNVPLGKNAVDEYRHYRVPPYSDDYNKHAMIKYFEEEYAKQQDNFETLDMDIDNTNDSATDKEEPIVLSMVPKNLDKDLPSPSLLDLEKKKRKLLAALDDSSSSQKLEQSLNEESSSKIDEREPTPPGVDPNDQSSSQEDSNSENLIKASTSTESVKKTVEIIVTESLETSTSHITSKNTVKLSNLGTPIIKSCTPYSRLPNPDNFMKDVSPVINFENLPNATGKYEQMTGILQKVRSTLKSFQKSNS